MTFGALPSGYSQKPKEIQFKGRTFFEVEWPIFQPCSRRNTTTGKIDTFDKTWLEQAVANQNQHFDRNYLAPIHIGHRNPTGKPADQAGFLGPARMTEENGIPTMLTKAFLTPEAFEQADKLFLPYRSVEILDPNAPEISSLALLQTQVPFFKFGLPGLQKFSDRATSATVYFHADDFYDERIEIIFAIDTDGALMFQDEEDDDRKRKRADDDTGGEPFGGPADEGGPAEDELSEEELDGLSDEELLQLLEGEEGGEGAPLDDELGGGFEDEADPFGDELGLEDPGLDDGFGGDLAGQAGLGDPGMEPITRDEFESFARTISDQIAGMHGTAAPAPAPPVIA